jgi:hypothetical protein
VRRSLLERVEGAAAVDACGWSTASNGERDGRRANISEHAPQNQNCISLAMGRHHRRAQALQSCPGVLSRLRTIDSPRCDELRVLYLHHRNR